MGRTHRGSGRPAHWDDFFAVASSLVEFSRDNKAEAIQVLEAMGEWDQFHLTLFMSTIQAEFCGKVERSSGSRAIHTRPSFKVPGGDGLEHVRGDSLRISTIDQRTSKFDANDDEPVRMSRATKDEPSPFFVVAV